MKKTVVITKTVQASEDGIRVKELKAGEAHELTADLAAELIKAGFAKEPEPPKPASPKSNEPAKTDPAKTAEAGKGPEAASGEAKNPGAK